MTETLDKARELVEQARRVVVLTGAGVSAESGVPTFRDAAEGLWERYRPEELATPAAFARDPVLVWKWYAWRRRLIAECTPNPAHTAIARFLERREDAVLVTQNVDGLHRAALDRPLEGGRILELHGSIFLVRCQECGREEEDRSDLGVESEATLPRCEECGGLRRPGVVWFGETLDPGTLGRAFEAASHADLCLVVGTSAVVYPAAGVPFACHERGGTIVEVNPDSTPLSSVATITLREPAGRCLPSLLA